MRQSTVALGPGLRRPMFVKCRAQPLGDPRRSHAL